MKKHTYVTNSVCAREITFEYENGCIYNVKFLGGCSGNLKAIAKLVNGFKFEQVLEHLEGNQCGTRPTSCGDQLCLAIKEVM